jgi:class 3 adenylate cyclase
VLVFGLSGLVLAAVASVLYLAVWAGQANTIDLARDKAELVLGLVEDRLRQRLEPARAQARFLADIIVRGRIDPLVDPRFVDFAGGALAGTPQVTGIAFTAPDGRLIRVFRTSVSGFGSAVEEETGAEFVAGYQQAARAREPFWGEIAWHEGLRQPLINLRAPVRDGDRVVGVLLVVVSVADLSLALNDVAEAFGATPFILVGRDHVLAHPTLVYGFPGRSAANPLPPLDGIGDRLMAQIWDPTGFVDRTRSERILGGRGHIARYDGDTYVYFYRETARYGSRWLIGTYMREATLEAAFARIWQAVFAGLGILAVAVVLAQLLGRWLTRRLGELARTAASVRDLDFVGARRVGGSQLRELDDTAAAFNAMLDGLRWFESYVPRALVRRLLRLGRGRAIESIQRDLTVMFTDISGFTSLSERMSAPEVAEFLNRHFALIDACIDREDGIIDKHLGDGVMAFWGAPDIQPDHARRACRAALAIREAVETDNARRRAAGEAPVKVRIGLHTGPVTVGNIGAASRLSYTIVGDTVNSADRLCELARAVDESGHDVVIVVSAATAEAAADGFDLTPVGAQMLRGRHAPLEVYRLLG